ncbi:HAD-IA family hydrolase [Candidatus Saccharibacteria bacterium]|nr:HAD-IA family hydrolase [Candidatus Saccharibacteria bacterium]HPG37363.1 HAD-IA family hydrolase [Candidatus Saccharibacteria bacterium]
MTMTNIEAIIADADGTLVDTLALIRHGQHETVTSYLTQYGLPPEQLPDYDQFETSLHVVMGGSARSTLEAVVKHFYADQPALVGEVNYDALHDMLNPVQDRIAPEYVTAYAGLSDYLQFVGSSGLKLAVSTSGSPHHVVRNFGIALPELGLTDLYKDTTASDTAKLQQFIDRTKKYFHLADFVVVTCDDVTAHKPDPEPFIAAMDRLAVSPNNSLILGDHSVDMRAGRAATAAEIVGITHGFDDKQTLLAAGATRIVDSLPELVAWLQRG